MSVVDQRKKDVRWRIYKDDGSTFARYDHALLAVLMDLRDELQAVNRRLRTISRKIPPRPRRRS